MKAQLYIGNLQFDLDGIKEVNFDDETNTITIVKIVRPKITTITGTIKIQFEDEANCGEIKR